MQINREGCIVEIKHGDYRLEMVDDRMLAWGNGAQFQGVGCIAFWSQEGRSTSLRIARTTLKKMIKAAKQ